jgi:hypothetical protein
MLMEHLIKILIFMELWSNSMLSDWVVVVVIVRNYGQMIVSGAQMLPVVCIFSCRLTNYC